MKRLLTLVAAGGLCVQLAQGLADDDVQFPVRMELGPNKYVHLNIAGTPDVLLEEHATLVIDWRDDNVFINDRAWFLTELPLPSVSLEDFRRMYAHVPPVANRAHALLAAGSDTLLAWTTASQEWYLTKCRVARTVYDTVHNDADSGVALNERIRQGLLRSDLVVEVLRVSDSGVVELRWAWDDMPSMLSLRKSEAPDTSGPQLRQPTRDKAAELVRSLAILDSAPEAPVLIALRTGGIAIITGDKAVESYIARKIGDR